VTIRLFSVFLPKRAFFPRFVDYFELPPEPSNEPNLFLSAIIAFVALALGLISTFLNILRISFFLTILFSLSHQVAWTLEATA
jgi:hypothetical protein